MINFTKEETKLLAPFFTNMDKPVFALINLPEVVKGALFSRYSRSPKSLRRILLEEFIQIPEMDFADIVGDQKNVDNQLVAIQKAESFYDRVLVGYGDDSVAELGGAHIALEGVSHIASKIIEDVRIGISPLEKSTRYVFFDEKVDGKYQYVEEPTLLSSHFRNDYLTCMDNLFGTYAKLIEPLTEFLKEKFPKDSATTDRAYKSTIRAKAADILRGILPAGVKTNIGLYGNGRAFEYLLIKMRSSPLVEIQEIATLMQEELDQVMPSFVKRTKSERGDIYVQYLSKTRRLVEDFADRIGPKRGRPFSENPGASLIEHSDQAIENILTALLLPYTHRSWNSVFHTVNKLSTYKRQKLLNTYFSQRQNRHHKTGRALEQAWYTFEIIANYGAYRDLQRHRMLSQQRQDLTTRYGYDMPKELKEAKLDRAYRKALDQSAVVFEKIADEFPREAQYVVPNAYRMRWFITLNLREVVHLCELRSSPQGHAHYRKIAQEIARQVIKVHPWAKMALRFVDWTESYNLERLESEKRIDQKIASLSGVGVMVK